MKKNKLKYLPKHLISKVILNVFTVCSLRISKIFFFAF